MGTGHLTGCSAAGADRPDGMHGRSEPLLDFPFPFGPANTVRSIPLFAFLSSPPLPAVSLPINFPCLLDLLASPRLPRPAYVVKLGCLDRGKGLNFEAVGGGSRGSGRAGDRRGAREGGRRPGWWSNGSSCWSSSTWIDRDNVVNSLDATSCKVFDGSGSGSGSST